jgi:hypothetical protein
MPNPVGINSYVTNFFSPNDLYMGVTHSINNIGGFQEFATISDRNDIPLIPNSVANAPYDGFTLKNDDPWSCGRRKVGMMVYVLETQKLYQLIPNGFFGNGDNDTVNTTGALGVSDWIGMPEWERAIRIDPINVRVKDGPSFENGFTTTTAEAVNDVYLATNDPNSCWVELKLGIDGNPISAVTYDANSGDLTITLTHDGSGAGTPIEFTVTLPTGYDGIYDPIVDDTTVVPTTVGGIEALTTAGELAGLSMNQMWDKLLFPTVNPTTTAVNLNLNDSYNLIEAETTINMVLTTTTNLGTLTNPAGPWAGPVNAAVIDDIGVGNMAQQVLNVGPAPTDIDDLTIAYITKLGINKFRLTASYDQGPMPVDSTGANYQGVRFNAQDKTNTTDFEAVWPIYIGTAQDLGGNNYGFEKRGLVSQSANNIPCVQNYGENAANNLWHRIAIPQAMVQGGDITIQLDAGPLGYQPSYPGGWAKTTTSFDVHNDAQNVPYFLYTKQAPQGGQATWIINW